MPPTCLPLTSTSSARTDRRTSDRTEAGCENPSLQQAQDRPSGYATYLQDSEDFGATAAAKAAKSGSEEGRIPITLESLGRHIVRTMDRVNHSAGVDRGLHYAPHYRSAFPGSWQEKFEYGHTSASEYFQNPYEQESDGKPAPAFMKFVLKKGHSASEGLKRWLGGLTIAECRVATLALMFDAVRAGIGDEKFDRIYGSTDSAIDKEITYNRLMLWDGMPRQILEFTPIARAIAAGENITEKELNQSLKPGQWYAFANHSDYHLKHPAGLWGGENAIFAGFNGRGERVWSGLGASNKTEKQMQALLVAAYNAPRTQDDYAWLAKHGIIAEVPKVPGQEVYKDPTSEYNPKVGTFDKPIDEAALLDHQGGLRLDSGQQLDLGIVEVFSQLD